MVPAQIKFTPTLFSSDKSVSINKVANMSAIQIPSVKYIINVIIQKTVIISQKNNFRHLYMLQNFAPARNYLWNESERRGEQKPTSIILFEQEIPQDFATNTSFQLGMVVGTVRCLNSGAKKSLAVKLVQKGCLSRYRLIFNWENVRKVLLEDCGGRWWFWLWPTIMTSAFHANGFPLNRSLADVDVLVVREFSLDQCHRWFHSKLPPAAKIQTT